MVVLVIVVVLLEVLEEALVAVLVLLAVFKKLLVAWIERVLGGVLGSWSGVASVTDEEEIGVGG